MHQLYIYQWIMGFKYLVPVFLIVLVSSAPQFCQTSVNQIPLYFASNEVQQISLSKYIKGYNLQFSSSHPQNVDVFEPYHVSAQGKTDFPEGYKLLSAAVRKSDYYLWDNTGIVAAINEDSQTVSIKYSKIKGNSIPEFAETIDFALEKKVHCYSASIINSDLDVALDCVSFEQNLSYVCIADREDKSTSCSSFDNIIDIGGKNEKVSEVLTIGEQNFLVSAFISKPGCPFRNQTFITIYNLNSGKPEFNFIIDRRMLQLDTLSLTDMIITEVKGVSYIQLTDPNYGVIRFVYQKYNGISDIEVINVPGVPYHIENGDDGNVLIAVNKGIVQYNRNYIYIRKYSLQETDVVVDIEASSYSVAVLTKGNQLLSFDRSLTEYKYLLSRQSVVQDTAIFLSPYYHNLLQIDLQDIKLVEVTSGYILIAKIQNSFDAVLTANSSGLICKTTFKIKMIDDDQINNAFQKKQLNKNYGFESRSKEEFYLSDYFGGSNLHYSYALSNAQNISSSSMKLNHVKKIDFKDPSQFSSDALFELVEINSLNFFYAYTENNKMNVKICSHLSNDMINCDLSYSKILPAGVVNIDGKKTSKGDFYLSWTYAKHSVEILDLKNTSSQITESVPNDFQFSQVVVGDQLIFYCQKQFNTFLIYQNGEMHVIDDTSFNDAEIAELGGFYPRQIILNPVDPYVFYVKFPVKIVTMVFVNGKVQILSIRQVSQQFIPDDSWSVVVGNQTILTLTEDTVYEFSILSNSSVQMLHSIKIDGGIVLPPQYSSKTDTVVVLTKDNNLQYIKMNEAKSQSLYYRVAISKPMWVISDSWLLIPATTAYYQWRQPILTVSLEVEKEDYFGDVTLTILASSQGKEKGIAVKSSLGALNYPVYINETQQNSQALTLPEVGNKTTIPFNISSLFSGSIAQVSLLCPFTIYDQIKLVTPLSNLLINGQIKKTKQIVAYGNVVIVLAQNSLNIINKTNGLVKGVPLPTEQTCHRMGISSSQLAVYCSGKSKQILTFTVSQKDIVPVQTYTIPSQIFIENAQDLQLYMSSKSQSIVAIHDSFPLDTSNTKKSDIKVFKLTSDSISLSATVNGETFGLSFQVPINSMTLSKNNMFVALGNKGIGHLNINQNKGTFIDLMKQQKIAKQIMDDTKFLRVKVIDSVTDSWEIAVTTSNSYNYVLSIHLKSKSLTVDLQEMYNKYGHQQTLNWVQVSQTYLMLSFFDQNTQKQSIALYRRSTHGLNNFYAIFNQKASSQSLQIPQTSIIKNGDFYNFYNAQQYGLGQYNLTGSYGLYLDYEDPGHFNLINVTVSNAYTKMSGSMDVHFDVYESSGLKWYAVVIMVALVLLVVGIAFGMYLRMRARKTDKTQSLVTETEELDEEI